MMGHKLGQHYNNMKKKQILLLLFIFVIVLLIILSLYQRDTYVINIEQIDDFSPDRRLIAYRNNKKIMFEELQYIDGTYLCSGKNSTVSYSEIIGIKELIIKIDGKKQKVAKIVEK